MLWTATIATSQALPAELGIPLVGNAREVALGVSYWLQFINLKSVLGFYIFSQLIRMTYIHNNTGISICPTPLLMQKLDSISVDNSNKQLKPTNHTLDTINIYKLNSENLIVWHTTLGKTQSTQKIIECYKSKQNKQTTREITLFHNILTSCTNVFNSGNANY